ncbi:Uncharacterised protein [uncultured archaeon]|nr:Uncharacterised protein [uncultured archaeon]
MTNSRKIPAQAYLVIKAIQYYTKEREREKDDAFSKLLDLAWLAPAKMGDFFTDMGNSNYFSKDIAAFRATERGEKIVGIAKRDEKIIAPELEKAVSPRELIHKLFE